MIVSLSTEEESRNKYLLHRYVIFLTVNIIEMKQPTLKYPNFIGFVYRGLLTKTLFMISLWCKSDFISCSAAAVCNIIMLSQSSLVSRRLTSCTTCLMMRFSGSAESKVVTELPIVKTNQSHASSAVQNRLSLMQCKMKELNPRRKLGQFSTNWKPRFSRGS